MLEELEGIGRGEGIEMADFNIEFGHIYADKKFGDEQVKSILRLKGVIKELSKKEKSFVTVVLIDEYSPMKNTLKDVNFLNSVEEEGINPDFVAYESALSNIAEEVISMISKDLLKEQKFGEKGVLLLSLKNNNIGLKDSQGKYSCSLLIAAWILARFGILKVPSLKKFSNKDFAANKLITILPKKYEETEEKVLDILRVTKYKDLLKNIRYEFF